jgi:fluoride exporter
MGFAVPLRENRLSSFSADNSYECNYIRRSFMMAYMWVAIGGALGSMARYWVSGVVAERFGMAFPWGTLIINVGGSFVIGIVGAVAGPEGPMDARSRAFASQFLMFGICGGYTTFSSFSWNTLQLMHDRQWLYAGGNILLSVMLCLIAVWLGYMLGAMLISNKGT